MYLHIVTTFGIIGVVGLAAEVEGTNPPTLLAPCKRKKKSMHRVLRVLCVQVHVSFCHPVETGTNLRNIFS